MRKYGLIGFPLTHSLSKQYFTDKFLKENLTNCSYDNYPIDSIYSFPDLLRDNPDLCGLNVTIPYKKEILRYVDVKAPCIDEIGAVNVLKIKRLGKSVSVCGFNSDVDGIRYSVLPFLRDGLKNALILGTGGASRAVSYTLQSLGIAVAFVSRTPRPGIMTYSDLDDLVIKNSNIIVNTTPLGMFPEIESKPDIRYDLLNEKHILFDLVYNPEMTAFLKMGKERGCRLITGLKMFYSQAERSWEIWNSALL
ncbi:MAG TPA: shikimate dehydrogenase [Bacteroidales bacterium]|jgi:shikimate dehydrogenase|nr:shikimate dehydrogenase [Bacteroidales bacterium]HQB36720.1 shikimate dehydrogenase [Bacteroidales bacterium]